MKTSWILSVYFLFIVGCAPTYIQPSFEDSNQYFLEKTINQLDVGKELKGIISPKYNIALLSIEDNLTLDKPIIAMIEDQIISSLIEGGYTIVERDIDVIQNIIKEGDKKYSLLFQKPSQDSGSGNIVKGSLEPGINFIETQLSAAGALISYRILEAGIVYREYPENKNSEIREAMVRLHIRVHKTWTGEIVHATNLSSSLSDTVRQEFVNQLASFHYSFFPYEYPLQEKVHYQGIKRIKSVKIATKDEKISKTSRSVSRSQLFILPRIGYGLNFNNGYGIITGGSISYGKINGGKFGADLMYLIAPNKHTMGLTGFYERTLFQYITLRGGASYLKTGKITNIGGTVGAGLSFSIGNIFIIQPMAEVNFGSMQNNIMGVNINMGFAL
jgi:hypothetical protein